MVMPANIRVSAQFPFPAAVSGAAPITVTKLNGVWTIGFTIVGFAPQVPPVGNYPTDFLLVYDSVAKTYFQMSLTSIVAALTPPSATRLQRSVTATPIVVQGNDSIINCNINVAAACALPAAATRNGAPLTFKDLGQAGAHNITITPNGVETIDGAANFVMTNNRQELTIIPFNDGVNSGWFIG